MGVSSERRMPWYQWFTEPLYGRSTFHPNETNWILILLNFPDWIEWVREIWDPITLKRMPHCAWHATQEPPLWGMAKRWFREGRKKLNQLFVVNKNWTLQWDYRFVSYAISSLCRQPALTYIWFNRMKLPANTLLGVFLRQAIVLSWASKTYSHFKIRPQSQRTY